MIGRVSYSFISVAIVTQHMQSTGQLSCKRIQEARISWKRTNIELFSATLRRKQLTAMEHSISPRKGRARYIPAHAAMCFLVLHAWSMNVPSIGAVQGKYSLKFSSVSGVFMWATNSVVLKF